MGKKVRSIMAAAALALAAGAALKEDETVIFFPTYAVPSPGSDSWQVPVHAWVFELEADSHVRRASLALFARSLGLSTEAAAHRIFIERARYFIVDNEGRKQLRITAGGETRALAKSKSNGHSKSIFELSAAAAQGAAKDQALRFGLDSTPPRPNVRGEAVLPARTGWSIISDIDDTIKISEVHDRRALLRRTFLQEFEAVPGMAERYRGWQAQSAVFHYVSASPWQLYPPLRSFFDQAGFPAGSFDLKDFRWKDRSFFNLFKSGGASKRGAIGNILRAFPERSFILIGDTGEDDPEIFGDAARDNPKQVQRLFLRRAACLKKPDLEQRLKEALAGVPPEKWALFDNGRELPEALP